MKTLEPRVNFDVTLHANARVMSELIESVKERPSDLTLTTST